MIAETTGDAAGRCNRCVVNWGCNRAGRPSHNLSQRSHCLSPVHLAGDYRVDCAVRPCTVVHYQVSTMARHCAAVITHRAQRVQMLLDAEMKPRVDDVRACLLDGMHSKCGRRALMLTRSRQEHICLPGLAAYCGCIR